MISRGEGRKWVGGTRYSWFRSPGNLSDKMVTKYWSQSPDIELRKEQDFGWLMQKRAFKAGFGLVCVVLGSEQRGHKELLTK